MKKFNLIFLTISIALISIILGLFVYENSLALPNMSDETLFTLSMAVDTHGQVNAYDPIEDKTTWLTPRSQTVNQFVLVQNRKKRELYYTTTPTDISDLRYDPNTQMSLHRLDLSSGKRRQISLPPGMVLQQLFSEVVNDKLFVYGGIDSDRHWWYYSLKQQHWKKFYADIPWQQMNLSQTTQLAVAANPYDNFGYALFSLIENTETIQPIGNFSQNFGFSPDGSKIIFQQKPERNPFELTSYLTVFLSNGASKNFWEDTDYQIYQAVWMDNQTLLALKKWTNGSEALVQLDVESGEEQEVLYRQEGVIEDIAWKKENLWITQKVLKPDLIGDPRWSYEIVRYDPVKSLLNTLPMDGILPAKF